MASHWQAGAGDSWWRPIKISASLMCACRLPPQSGTTQQVSRLKEAPLPRRVGSYQLHTRKQNLQENGADWISKQTRVCYRKTELNKQANKSVCPSQFLNRVIRKRCQTRDWGFPGRGGPIITALVHFDSISEPPAADLFSVISKRQPTRPSVASVDMELRKALSRLISVNYLSFQWFTKGTDVILTFTL